MIKIKIPNNNLNERRYILDIIFNEFLGAEYSLDIGSIDYEITLPNKKVLTIKDTFFNKFPNDLEYLKLENIPNKIEELDIFSASFFMLTRWEEYVNKSRDNHNRFPATESLAYKQGFLERPIVNEYVEELKAQLIELDSSLIFKKRTFNFLLTHDIDRVYRYTKLISGLGEIFFNFRDREIKKALKNIYRKLVGHLNFYPDPYDTTDYLMNISEKTGLKSYFFLHSSCDSKYDNNNYKYLKEIIDKITKRGHHIGYHPGYNTFLDIEQFRYEKQKIESFVNQTLDFGRQHYLRFQTPTTWQIWEDAGMKWDSTLGYAEKEGFRCGVCYPYSVFNILSREKLRLKERPLIVMDANFSTYQKNLSKDEVKKRIKKLIKEVKRYDGEFVFLWHNSSINGEFLEKYEKLYEDIINESNS